jgi:hypothetical protein
MQLNGCINFQNLLSTRKNYDVFKNETTPILPCFHPTPISSYEQINFSIPKDYKAI